MIGWGDILFLVSLAFYFSLLNFIVFYIGSLVLALLIALVGSFYSSDKKIPLAGLQALIFALFLTSARLFFHLDLMSDNYWLEYLMR
jgi:membrane associated rhomboid family serine protease